MKNRRWLIVGIASIAMVTVLLVSAWAQVINVPPTYPTTRPKASPDSPMFVTLQNTYIMCRVGIGGIVEANAEYDDDELNGRGDKTRLVDPGEFNDWGVAGRYGICALAGDPEQASDDNRPLTFMGQSPCHYFGYWKLRIGNDIRMIGDSTGRWYKENSDYSPPMTPTKYDAPPQELAIEEPALGRMGPFLRAIWVATGGNGSEIHTEIRIHLVRDLVRFEYRITNKGTVTERVGFQQIGDVETNDPINHTSATGGYYGPYNNACYCFVPGSGAAKPLGSQRAMIFGGVDNSNPRKPVTRTPVPNWVDYYDSVTAPACSARSIFGEEDATKPDIVAIGEYNDLYHKNMWVPTEYRPDTVHGIYDMCWALVWDQKDLRPGETRTLITYYGVGASTNRWTYKPTPTSKTVVPDYAVAAVQAPKSVKYDSTAILPGDPEIAPGQFTVKAWVNDTATDPGPFDLMDTTATIHLPAGLELVPDVVGNVERKEMGMVQAGTESDPVEWQVRATGEYSGELSMYVSFVDNAAEGAHWQQTVVRKIYVPAVKRGLFPYGWNLMHVPFNFNDFRIDRVFNLVPGTFAAKYWDPKSNNYLAVNQVKPGQGFWMYVGGLSWGDKQPFFLPNTAAIVGEAPGTGQQTMSHNISLSRGWNMIGNPFVYPIYWGQALVYSALNGGQTITLDAALRNRWLSATLFSWNTDKWDYDTTSSKDALLNPWKGYWVYAYQPVILIMRPPVFPMGDVTANPGGQ